MRRHLLNAIAALSLLLLCLATVSLWVRSYWVSDWISWSSDGPTNFNIITGRGKFVLTKVTQTDGSSWQGRGWQRSGQAPYDPIDAWQVWSTERLTIFNVITWGRRASSDGSTQSLTVMLPYWLVAILTFAFPCVQIIRRFPRDRRIRAGLCPICGYDLRATPGRCPECGTVPEKC